MLHWPVLDQLSLASNVGIFTAAAAVTWLAGTRLGRCAAEISARVGAGQALIGMLLLGGVASLPELAMSVTAAAGGDAQLSITTLVGGVPATMAMLAIADAVVGGRPVSARIRHPVVLVHGAVTIGLLAVVAAAIVVGDAPLWAAGVWSLLVAALYVGLAAALRTQEGRTAWVVPDEARARDDDADRPRASGGEPTRSGGQLAAATTGWAAVTAAAGYVLAIAAGAIARQSGLGSGIVGTALGGIATSLPELSTMVASLRLRQHEMAFGDAFGTCLFSMMLIYPADLALPGGPLFGQVGPDALLATLLGILTTTVYLVGLLHRGRRRAWRVGIDSLVVAVLYVVGLGLIARLA